MGFGATLLTTVVVGGGVSVAVGACVLAVEKSKVWYKQDNAGGKGGGGGVGGLGEFWRQDNNQVQG